MFEQRQEVRSDQTIQPKIERSCVVNKGGKSPGTRGAKKWEPAYIKEPHTKADNAHVIWFVPVKNWNTADMSGYHPAHYSDPSTPQPIF